MEHRRPLRLAVLGDSIGYGIGAATTADTLGARSAGLPAQVRRTVPRAPDLALVVIGANRRLSVRHRPR
jgi:hypothetical protein